MKSIPTSCMRVLTWELPNSLLLLISSYVCNLLMSKLSDCVELILNGIACVYVSQFITITCQSVT